MSNKQHTLSEVLTILQNVYGYKNQKLSLSKSIDKMPNIERQKTSGKITQFYTEEDIKYIANELGLTQIDFMDKAKELREQEIQEEEKEQKIYEEHETLEYKLQTVYESQFNDIANRFMIEFMFTNGGFVKGEIDKESLMTDLKEMDKLLNYADVSSTTASLDDLATMMKLDNKIKDFRNYTKESK